MSALQQAFESRLIVRSLRLEPNFDQVLSIIRQSPKDDLAVRCPATGASLLFYAAQRKNDTEATTLCQVLCDELAVCDPLQVDCNQQSALFFAARDGNASCVKYLLSKGCLPDQRDSASQTALFYAARDGRLNAVKTLLDGGADINSVDHLGQTALFYAARDGRLETVSIMLERGANILARDRHRRTALFYAQRSNHRDLVNLLKAAGGGGTVTPTKSGGEVQLNGSNDTVARSQTEAGPMNRSAKRSRSPEQQIMKQPAFGSDAVSSCPPTAVTASPEPQPVRRRLYRLCIRGPLTDDSSLTWLSAPNDKVQLFESLAPSISVWPRSAQVSVKGILDDLRSKWQPLALSMLDELSQVEGGWIFSKPVDCKAWGCPDYYDVILTPMDFTTMKKKFKNQCYERCSEFLADMQLVFSNCFRYNKPESHVATVARNVESTFKNLQATYGFEQWVARETVVEEWYQSATSQSASGDHHDKHEDCEAVL